MTATETIPELDDVVMLSIVMSALLIALTGSLHWRGAVILRFTPGSSDIVKRCGESKLVVRTDTLSGTLHNAGEQVAMGTMAYKFQDRMTSAPTKRGTHLSKTSVNLKFIPCVTGQQRVAEMVAYNPSDIIMQYNCSGPARLLLIPHVNATVAYSPVLSVVEGRHFKADLTLPHGRIAQYYLA